MGVHLEELGVSHDPRLLLLQREAFETQDFGKLDERLESGGPGGAENGEVVCVPAEDDAGAAEEPPRELDPYRAIGQEARSFPITCSSTQRPPSGDGGYRSKLFAESRLIGHPVSTAVRLLADAVETS